MPYVDLKIHPVPTTEQAKVLADGVTRAMADIAGKRREVTAVHVTAADTALWTIGGEQSREPTAYVDVKITSGTNTPEEKAALLGQLHRLLLESLGGLAEASYIVIHELPAENWGYAGLSQAERAATRL
jgi:4-oxalocrotonate tautomerase